MLKRILAVLLAAFMLSFSLSGCSLGADTDSLLNPPRLSGELDEIHKALMNSVKEKITLKYPTSGEYRSAIVLKDLNNDGTDEALAFYSTTTDKILTMHMNLIVASENGWVSVGEIKCVASGVESVQFANFDDDGTQEIIVGWTVYGSVDKSVGIYSVQNGSLVQRLLEKYNDFMCDDFTGNGKTDLFLTHLNDKDKSATAKIFSLTAEGVNELGSAAMDGAVTSYSKPIKSTLPDGRTVLYLDAVKGTGMITEILVVTNGRLQNVAYNEKTAANEITYRDSSVSVRDIDGDSQYEFPRPVLLTQGSTDAENVYKTDWLSFDGKEFVLKVSAIMNYTDGFYVIIPEKWEGKITALTDTAARTRTFLRLDEKSGNSAQALVRVQTVPKASFDTFTLAKNSFTVGNTENFVYVATIYPYSGKEAVTQEEFMQLFKLLG